MDWCVIYWNNRVFTFDELDDIDDDLSGFYTILGAKQSYKEWKDLDLLYIGMAYQQTIKQRLDQPHEAYNCIKSYLKYNPEKIIIIMVGDIVSCSLQRLTEQFVKDVECALIFSNQPWCNQLCKDSYTGRALLIINEGDYTPLKKITSCQPQI